MALIVTRDQDNSGYGYDNSNSTVALLLNQTCRTTRTGKIVYVDRTTQYFLKNIVLCDCKQQFSQFVLFDMFDSKVVWPLCATVVRIRRSTVINPVINTIQYNTI